MCNTILVKLIQGEKITDTDIENALFTICDDVHSGCNENCPVFALNNNQTPDTAKDFEVNRGCDCFKNGKAMRLFILKKIKSISNKKGKK
ncbi:MAG: hypothetical protein WC346_05515 [Methanogenium sp.]|jgi:hypothetical protein